MDQSSLFEFEFEFYDDPDNVKRRSCISIC